MEGEAAQRKTAMVLLTGYLGSGKTTLISHILKNQTQYRVAVIQNEFADEMGIESPLMQDSQGKPFDKFYELPNGCICCTAKGDLLVAIEYLIKNEQKKLDFILVETNGLADPSEAVKGFWVDDNADFPAELRSIHTVVPAHRFQSLLSDEIFIKQILYADNILLNQSDRSTAEEMDNVEGQIRRLNPIANIIRTSFCDINLAEIFNVDGFNLRNAKSEVIERIAAIHSHVTPHSGDCTHQEDDSSCTHKEHNSHSHPSTEIESFFFVRPAVEFDCKKLEVSLGELLWEHPTIKVFRIKGLVNVAGDESMYSLQGVEDIFEVKKSELNWNANEQRVSKFLFICKKALRSEIESVVDAAIIFKH